MMAFYYVEPRPGNEKDFLKRTVDALDGYKVTVIGCGYPPIYVELDEDKDGAGFREKIGALVKEFKEEIKVYPPFPPNQPRCHRQVYKLVEECTDEDFSKPQPHIKIEINLTEQEKVYASSLKIPDKIDTTQKGMFDVFLAHNSLDKSQIMILYKLLNNSGIKTWLDEEEIRPGTSFQDAIQAAIPLSKSVAMCIGLDGLGPVQIMELRASMNRFLYLGIPVIPVLLPGIEQIPDSLLFLKELRWVKFQTIEDEEALKKLIWGITGVKPGNNQSPPSNSDEKAREMPKEPQKPTTPLTKKETEGTPNVNPEQLKAILSVEENFETSDLSKLCETLGTPFSKVEGNSHTRTAEKLVDYCFNREDENKLLSELTKQAYKMRSKPFKRFII